MIKAHYFGETDDELAEEFQYYLWEQWVAAFREDIRKFKEYFSANLINKDELICKLDYVASNIDNTYPYNYEDGYSKIDVGYFYTLINYKVRYKQEMHWLDKQFIASRDYKTFIFLDEEENNRTSITYFFIQDNKVYKKYFPKTNLVFIDEDDVLSRINMLSLYHKS